MSRIRIIPMLLLALLLMGAAVGSYLLDKRFERAQIRERVSASAQDATQRLQIVAVEVALEGEIRPVERRELAQYRRQLDDNVHRLLSVWPHPTLRRDHDRFLAAVNREARRLDDGRRHEGLGVATASVTPAFDRLQTTLQKLHTRARLDADGARRWSRASLVLLFTTILAILAFGSRQLGRAKRERTRAIARENERLLELDRLKDDFVASVSHELRTPLTSIRGYLELVREGEVGPLTDEQEEFLEIVDRNADRLLHLIGDLLDVAQVESGRLVLERKPFDLTELVRQSVLAARPVAEARTIELRLEAQPVPPVSADPKRLGQVIDNLLSNALKFTPAGGSVDVRLCAPNGHARLEVADTGMGIPEAEQTRLFNRFFRTTTASEQAIQGTGLGLWISKAIVEAHYGAISFDSVEGEGTTFRIDIPAAEAMT